LLEHLRRRAGVHRANLHDRRRDLGILRDRKDPHRRDAGERDEEGDDDREDRAVDEEAGEHYFFPSPFGDGAPVFAGAAAPPAGGPPADAAGSPTCTGAPGKKIFASPSTITWSPGCSPEVMIQSVPVQSPTVIGFGIALLS